MGCNGGIEARRLLQETQFFSWAEDSPNMKSLLSRGTDGIQFIADHLREEDEEKQVCSDQIKSFSFPT